MWTRGFAVALLLTAAVVAVAGMRNTPVRRAVAAEARSEAEAALDRPLPNFALHNVPLEDALPRLARAGGVQIVLDRTALESRGIHPRVAVTVPPLPKATVGRVLHLALESASLSPGRLGYAPREDHLLVSTDDELAKDVRVRVYDVRDLMSSQAQLVPFGNTPVFGTVSSAPQGAQGLFGAPSPAPPPWIDQLTSLIMETVAPDSWRDAGGTVGAMRELGGRLVICQTWKNHQLVQVLLDELRQPAPPVPPALVKYAWNDRLQRWVEDPGHADPELALVKALPAEARLDAASLPAALAELGKLAGVEILLDHRALAAAGYDAGVARDLRRPVGGQTLAQALGGVLAAAGRPLLGYTLRDSGLVVTTGDEADSVELMRVYDIRDLVSQSADVTARAPSAESLVGTIIDTVSPDSWRDNGGRVGVIRERGGLLVVIQNLRNHQALAAILAGLRAGRPATRP